MPPSFFGIPAQHKGKLTNYGKSTLLVLLDT